MLRSVLGRYLLEEECLKEQALECTGRIGRLKESADPEVKCRVGWRKIVGLSRARLDLERRMLRKELLEGIEEF